MKSSKSEEELAAHKQLLTKEEMTLLIDPEVVKQKMALLGFIATFENIVSVIKNKLLNGGMIENRNTLVGYTTIMLSMLTQMDQTLQQFEQMVDKKLKEIKNKDGETESSSSSLNVNSLFQSLTNTTKKEPKN